MARPTKDQQKAMGSGQPVAGPTPATLPSLTYLPYLRAWRAKGGIGLLELQRLAGVGRTTLVEIEAQRRMASPRIYGKLANALGIKPSLLIYINPEDLPEGGAAGGQER